MKDKKLSRREREIMDALLELGDEASGEEIREKLPAPPVGGWIAVSSFELWGRAVQR